jgi:iron complex transport system ATP-binding protein
MLQLVRNHCDERNTAAVIVTHDINLTAEFADNVLLLKQGRMMANGPPREVLTEKLLSDVLEIKVLVDAHPLSGAPRITPAHELRRQVGADTAP